MEKEKETKKEPSKFVKFIKRTWWTWGITALIAFFFWALAGQRFSFIYYYIIVCISYFIGVIFRSFWYPIRAKCPICGEFLYCRQCKRLIFEIEEEND